MTLGRFIGQIKKIDEYDYIKNVLKVMNNNNAQATRLLIGTLSEEQQKYLQTLCNTTRVAISCNGIETTVSRKIVKGKSKHKAMLP